MQTKRKENQVNKHYCEEGVRNLAAAIVEQAVSDYLRALKKINKHPEDEEALGTIEECELFFKRDAEFWTGISAKTIVNAVQRKIVKGEKMGRKKM